MAEKLAVKRLTRSDLTFFVWHFENANAGNQKAINLNADVFIDELFPDLLRESARHGDRFPLDLEIYGPDAAGMLNVQRKILKGARYKNWRLDGEFVRDDPDRFRPLQEGDTAVIEFVGERYPSKARLVLLATQSGVDAALQQEFDSFLSGRRMAPLAVENLQQILASVNPIADHPLRSLGLAAEIQDAALGGVEAIERLLKRRQTRRISKAELREARERADEVGGLGEEFVNDYLSRLKGSGAIKDFEWEARSNAIAPFDFEVTLPDGTRERIDAKSTAGPFEGTLHVSTAEALCMNDAAVAYRIYRVFHIDGGAAKLRISEPLVGLAADLLKPLQSLPTGVQVDGFSLSPRVLRFAPTIDLMLEAEELDQ